MNRAEEMRAALGRWKKSGLSLHAFAKREETSYSKLQYWAARTRRGARQWWQRRTSRAKTRRSSSAQAMRRRRGVVR